jgi:hypothetical protein
MLWTALIKAAEADWVSGGAMTCGGTPQVGSNRERPCSQASSRLCVANPRDPGGGRIPELGALAAAGGRGGAVGGAIGGATAAVGGAGYSLIVPVAPAIAEAAL